MVKKKKNNEQSTNFFDFMINDLVYSKSCSHNVLKTTNPFYSFFEKKLKEKLNKIKDQRRIDYHHSHLLEIQKAIDDGVDCMGYFAWSLMDNFEWAQGFSQRFGLVWVDFESLERTPKASYHWYKNYISNNK